ncbi:MAG: hypothetical protein RL120_05255 [Gammaproteobacteria bacterium]
MVLSDYLFSHRKAVITVAVVLLLLLVFPSLFAIVFPSREELSYQAGFSTSNCRAMFIDQPGEAQRCLSTYRVELGNTGVEPQALVTVVLADVPPIFRKYTGAINIVASARPPVNPEITETERDGDLYYEIRGLEPNRLVAISISTLGVDAYQGLQDMEISVDAAGTVIEASPYVTVTSRFFRNILGVFGF